MSRTHRKNFERKPIRDGQWGRKCPEPDCNVCGHGFYKRILRRIERRKGKKYDD